MPNDFNSQLFAGTQQVISAGNAIAQGNLNKATRKWNDQMYDKQRLHALEDWERQNTYNSPAAQMARLKAAGLNPNLVYGSGVNQDSANVRSSDTGSWHPQAPSISGDGLAMMYDLEMKNAQLSNMAAQRKVMEMDAVLRGAQVLQTTANTNMSSFDLEQKQRIKDFAYDKFVSETHLAEANNVKTWNENDIALRRDEREAAMNSSNLREAGMRILRMRSQNATDATQRRHIEQQIDLLQKDNQLKTLELQLAEKGIQKSDPLWLRALIQLLHSTGKL